MTGARELVVRARHAPPADWRVYPMPRRPLPALVIMTFFGTAWGAAALLWLTRQALAHVSDVPSVVSIVEWVLLPTAIALVATVARVLAELTLRGLVVVTDHEVVVYSPMQLTHRRVVLTFSPLTGMALQRVDWEGVDTPTVITFTTYRLALRRTTGRTESWSLNIRYRYRATGAVSRPIYEDIIERFELTKGNDADGLDSRVTVKDYRFLR